MDLEAKLCEVPIEEIKPKKKRGWSRFWSFLRIKKSKSNEGQIVHEGKKKSQSLLNFQLINLNLFSSAESTNVVARVVESGTVYDELHGYEKYNKKTYLEMSNDQQLLESEFHRRNYLHDTFENESLPFLLIIQLSSPDSVSF